MAETVVPGNTPTHFVECITVSSAGREKKKEYLMKIKLKYIIKNGRGKNLD